MALRTPLSADAVTVAALAGSALAYASSTDEEVERWLRTLRGYGQAGVLLQAAGVCEERPVEASNGSNGHADAGPEKDRMDPAACIAAVLACAETFAATRRKRVISTIDLLLGVIRIYGEAFDRALELRGTDRVELLAHLEVRRAVVTD